MNAAIDAQQKPADNAAKARAFVGLRDENERGSSLLNALDDWETVHADVKARRGMKISLIQFSPALKAPFITRQRGACRVSA